MESKANYDAFRRTDAFRPQLAKGNREALEDLFSRYRSRLYKTAFRVLRNPEDAEDALQDGLLAAFRKLDTFEGRSQFSTWLTRIVFNAAAMQMRRRRPEVMNSIDSWLDSGHQPWAHGIRDQRPNPEELYAHAERRQIVGHCLQSLPVPYRHAAWLCIVQGLKIREAAKALGLPMGTLKTQLHRAKLRCRKQASAARPWQGSLVRGSSARN